MILFSYVVRSMNKKPTIDPSQHIQSRVLFYQTIAFGLLILLLWLDECLDLPHLLFNAPKTPVNWRESAIETLFAMALGFFSIQKSSQFINKIHFLERLIHICMFCKKIRQDDQWIPLETYIAQHSESVFSHGLCPDCYNEHYGDWIDTPKPDHQE